MTDTLRVVIIKPSKYGLDDYVERFRRGFMPNATIPYIASMIPDSIGSTEISLETPIDEYVHTDLEYLKLLERRDGVPTLVLLVGVQSHQFHRALDLAAFAKKHGCLSVIGGPHPMTCDTSMLQGHSQISFAQAEAESTLPTILDDAAHGYQLRPVYGENQRWATVLDPAVLRPPSIAELKRSMVRMLGVYPSRGCPFTCNFCSVIKIAGRRIRSQPIQTTIDSLLAAKAAGVRVIMFTSDNFNKIPDVEGLLTAMIEEGVALPFFCQCDAQIAAQPELIRLMKAANCYEMFVGAESFNRQTLLAAHKAQNHPDKYAQILRACRESGIHLHLSNIIGFPADTEAGILQHLRTLQLLDPTMASFYVLSPIPGTEQYDDFMAAGLISEKNLDRFDTISPVWDHPHLSGADRTRLLHHCYREFYSVSHTVSTIRWIRQHPTEFGSLRHAGYTAFSRYCTWRKRHPMSGGVWRVIQDHSLDYQLLRQQTFGFDLVPLPKSLHLSEADQAINKVNLRLVN